MSEIDLEQRPKTYFSPQPMVTYLVEKVKNAAIRERLELLLSEGRIEEIKELLDEVGITANSIQSLEAIHPMFMGGNYLPDMDEGEVEVARIEIASTTGDVTCLFAKKENGIIKFRVVDEYGGDTLNFPTEVTTDEPMTLREMTEFFHSAWSLIDVLEMNFDGQLEPALAFFKAKSKFYPEFDELCRERVVAAFPKAETKEEYDT
ncbi:hypothetical protein [Roseicyclus sp.]|uniref:hypothetical protein n=1 Tax=Roseicyclus sp. TaxID=1914329 RepID=UPI001BD14F15|nr:hypothetical protein [Roseicyclus sp.]